MRDIYAETTAKIIAAIEAGTPPWHKPWASGGPKRPLRSSGQAYRGINTVSLWAASVLRGFESPWWFTYKQAQELGAQVRKGAKSEAVVYWGRIEDRANGEAGGDVGGDAEGSDGERRTRSFMRYYSVFNAEEIEGLPARFIEAPPARPAFVAHEMADATITATGATIGHGGSRAFYRPATDSITLPVREAFDSPAAYYGTAFHELAHWTGAPARLDREKGKRFGDHAYAVEELIAELGAAFLCADHSIPTCPRADHASYIASWVSAMKADSRAVFAAAAAAERAATFILDFSQPEAVAA